MANLNILVGLPASGKSTWANNNKGNSVIVSTDELRYIINGSVLIQRDSARIFSYAYDIIKMSLEYGQNVIFDATNLHKKDRLNMLEYFKPFADDINLIVFRTPFDECLRRNNKREFKVPLARMEIMNKNYEVPSEDEGFANIIYIN